MDETKTKLGEIERHLEQTAQRQIEILKTISRLDKQNSETLSDVALVLREQARNNLDTSRLLNDLSSEVAGLAFEIEELKSWRRLTTGGHSYDWISESRAEQSRMAYRALKDSFNETELREIIMNLSIDPAEITGGSLAEMAMWLVEHCRRNGKFWNLVKEGRVARPMGLWPVSTGELGGSTS
jgi:hypothetical protein